MPIAAPLIIGGLAAAGTVGGALIGSNAASSAADKQYQAAMAGLALQQQGLDFQEQIHSDNQAALNPYMQLGQGGATTLETLYGLPGGNNPGGQPDYSAFYNSPDYGFALQQGIRATDMSAASKGLLQSGGQGRALQTFGQGLASQQFGNYFNRMLSLTQLGSNAAQAYANSGNQSGQQVANSLNSQAASLQAGGQAQASGIVGGANAVTGGINSGVNNLLLYSQLNKSPSGYGGNPLNIQQPQVGNYGTNQGNAGGTGGSLGGLY